MQRNPDGDAARTLIKENHHTSIGEMDEAIELRLKTSSKRCKIAAKIAAKLRD
jgi:hypothetical protein